LAAPLLNPDHGKKRNDMSGIRIVGSGISVYEVEVDLGELRSARTDRLNGFIPRLLGMFPAMRKHECYAGEAGGFVRELELGTDLAHVMEHVILELLKVSSRPHRRFSGWTRKKGKHYVIHFQAPDGSTGQCAALSAIKIIEGILSGRKLSKRALIRDIRESKEVEH
jgi:cyanophycin synthetase